ncbi:unnamed protein product [Coregonus sp. 'balchen']|nr:unnamed protein product [Coregonus sp. 'balchen']
MDRVELKKVCTEADDDSTDSLDDRFTEPIDSEKATINSHFLDEDGDAESHKFLTNGIMKKKKYEEYQEEYHPGHTSFGMSVFNLSNAIMGSGILGLSYAMANTGIKLGERAFGWPGKMAAFGSITLQNIGAMSSYLFIVKYELPEVIRAFMGLEESSGEWYMNGNYLVVFVSIGIILPLCILKNLGYLGYTSGFSLSCMVFFLGVLIYKKYNLPCPMPFMYHHTNHSMNGTALGPHALHNGTVLMHFSRADMSPASYLDNHHTSGVRFEPHPDDVEEMCTPKYFVFNSQTAYTVPILAFSFVCHPEILPIYSELKDRSRRKMQNVSNLSILAMLVMYMLSALFGYLTFYENVEAELLHTFTKIRSSINTMLFSQREFSWVRSSAATMLIFILPAAFYLRLVKSVPMRSLQKISAAIFLVVGIIFMFSSLSLIVMDWIHNPPGSGGGH